MNDIEIKAVLSKLTELGYRFTYPLPDRTKYSDANPPEKLFKVVILDTETTGLNPETDKIIELGMVSFECCANTGQAFRVLGTFNQLEAPGFPIPPESTKIHGITDEMVSGKLIDENEVFSFIENAKLIIAHNAQFDRPFVETKFPVFENKAWACSLSQIPWKEEGFGSASQEFLAYRFGFHYESHRAINDCTALLEILQHTLPESGALALKRLLQSVIKKELKVSPIGSPYDTKDLLKERGYRWNPELKLWSGIIALESLENEVEWLKAAVYGGRSFKLEQESIIPKNRFSTRRGVVEIVSY